MSFIFISLLYVSRAWSPLRSGSRLIVYVEVEYLKPRKVAKGNRRWPVAPCEPCFS
jgi:hypothetical protein